MKWLLVLGVIGAGLWLKRFLQESDAKENAQAQRPHDAASEPIASEPPMIMVPCCQCGVMLPKNEALALGQAQFSCAQHGPKTGA